ncbi:uncharacterized protein LAJ45_01381 [Morchella importuna]|uniref:uncharacterized protein n=1 Tax=Morchella importuna TaxID=1174673 RepID=UPI001E8D52B2|nr:uncharacterized protein LAJ45_01381 [Morchella importuna]KAH8154850.1 hypothetical protein LAJ45_01381 [Morchella importuna]
MQIRTVDGGILDADEQPEAVVRVMGEDGVVIICQRSNITVRMNSLNRVQALESRGDLGFTTFEFMDKEIFMSSAVAKILFLLHGQYNMGTSKLLIPVPRFEDTAVRSYNAYVATLFGGPQNGHVTFHLTVDTASQQRKMVTLNGGDILLCTDKIQRTIPQTRADTAFVSETFYYPPHLPNVRLEENLVADYMVKSGGELQKDPVNGNVVWKYDNFMMRERGSASASVNVYSNQW